MKHLIQLRVNGEDYEIFIEPWKTLLEVLREELNYNSVKEGCGIGYCGTCTVLINGKSVKSCLVLASQVQGSEITTIEGLTKNGELDPLQKAFVDHFAVQCGFCTPGMILSAKALLNENTQPNEEEVRMALIGNLCRCTGYVKIIEAVLAVAEETRKEGQKI